MIFILTFGTVGFRQDEHRRFYVFSRFQVVEPISAEHEEIEISKRLESVS